jgi:hypothetical protein
MHVCARQCRWAQFLLKSCNSFDFFGRLKLEWLDMIAKLRLAPIAEAVTAYKIRLVLEKMR